MLSPSRPSGWGVGAIPISEIKAWCEMYELVGEEREEFLELIRALDDEYLKFHREKSQSTRKGK